MILVSRSLGLFNACSYNQKNRMVSVLECINININTNAKYQFLS